ncbi:MAG: branched-chain amino acid ABC transporter permease [Rhodospirillaceae bacterium]|nr:branched-chain amino acid ABC transporter permease [Rhodospirillaceae bacterium]|tara:strand:- start:2416 stop:3372 length:957 start_codon:yes stop_codon:yes gene_type:complete
MKFDRQAIVVAIVFVLLAFVPLIASLTEVPFYLDLGRRMMILAIGALSLNLIMGYGGMISFGHAVFIGIGAYVVGICAEHEIVSGFIQWPLALLACAVVAVIFGSISLRTRGVYFIMITLALAQMMYFLGVSVDRYGGDDGLPLAEPSDFSSLIDLSEKTSLYYLVFVLLLLCLWICQRLVNSRFGMVIQGARSNEARMEAIGFPTFRYKLTAFVIAGVMAGLAGALLANHTDFVNPDMMHWTRSGDLIIMVLLGGMGSLAGPIVGALVFILLEEALTGVTEYWQLIFGPFLILVVLYARGGLLGFLEKQPSSEKTRG